MEKAVVRLPKALAKGGELVIISRHAYEQLIQSVQKRVAPKLDFRLLQALTEVEQGKISRRFKNSKALMRSLRR